MRGFTYVPLLIRNGGAISSSWGAKIIASKKSKSLSWCCVYTKPGCETLAAGSLENEKGHLTYLPRIATEKYVAGALVRHWEVMFPRYLFVALDLSRLGWETARWARGVSKLVGAPNGKPYVVPPLVMEAIFKECGGERAEIIVPAVKPKALEDGEYVRVVGGSYSSFQGICKLKPKNRVEVLLQLFGRPMEVDLDLSQVERVA